MKVEMMTMFMKEINAINELQKIKTELKDDLNKAAIILNNEVKIGLSETAELNKSVVLKLGAIETILTDKYYDEETLSDERSTSSKKDSESFYDSILIDDGT